MRRWRTAALAAWALAAASGGCADAPGAAGGPCAPGDPGCTCAQSANGTSSCVQGQCAAVDVCGSDCCDANEQCVNGQCTTVDASQCIYIPKPGEFEAPVHAWRWPYLDPEGTKLRPIELPGFRQVMSTPVVVRLHGEARPDEPPSVVFNSFETGGGPAAEGVLRVIRGDTGEPVWSATDPAARVNGESSPAAGDLDGDGDVEIVSGAWEPVDGMTGGIIAFDSDGAVLWRTPGVRVGWGGPAIADLDGQLPAEIVIGSAVLDGATGKVLCAGDPDNEGGNGIGPLSTAMDIDADGRLEVVTGAQAYRFRRDASGGAECRPMWPPVRLRDGSIAGDGFPAVAQIFNDPALPTTQGRPQVAVVTRGTVRVMDWTGGTLWDPVALPGGGLGGPPTIADFDGDGRPDIGVAGLASYTVFKPGTGVMWTVGTQDASSSTTGSSVFDFDGNGRPEVVYADECYVHVYDGMTGMEVFSAPNSSCTAYEMPVVADVDGTGAAGLLVPANDICRITCPWGTHRGEGMRGLTLFKSPSDAWVGTRAVWNQHTYHMSNVDDFGGVASPEAPSWGPGTINSFRQNFQGQGTFAAPDMVIQHTRLDGTQCPGTLRLVAIVGDIGSRGVRAGTPVAFYTVDAGGNRELLGVGHVNEALRPGQRAEATFDWQGPPRTDPIEVEAVVGEDGTGKFVYRECDATNNVVRFGPVACREAG